MDDIHIQANHPLLLPASPTASVLLFIYYIIIQASDRLPTVLGHTLAIFTMTIAYDNCFR